MEAFQYKAVDDRGRITVGKIDAVNIADLETRLDRMGLDLVNYKDLGPTGPKITGVGVSRRDLITFCFHLEQTGRAGVPILESLEDLRDSSDNPRLREVIAAMIDSIEGGQTLSQAMRNYPAVFDSIFCNLVRAGEQSGEIAQVFYQLGENLKWQDEQAAQTKKLLIYPAFVGTVVIAVVFFLMVYLVPELLRFVKTMGQELAASDAFATCQVQKVFKNVCLRSPVDSADRGQISSMVTSFKGSNYNLKQVFAESAVYCMGD